MDDQRSFLLNWAYFHYQEKSMDELRQSSFLLTMELEDTKLKAQQELKMRDEEITQLKQLLNRAIKQRDEAQEKCQKVLFEKVLLQKQLQQSAPQSGISSIEDEPRKEIEFSISDCDESIVSSPVEGDAELPIMVDRPLPEKGMLLQAVMKAGPLLQTLLLAGPLPQWRHPPPPLDTIPPPPVVVPPPALANQEFFQGNVNVNNCGRVNRKRGLLEGCDSSVELKYQRIVLQ